MVSHNVHSELISILSKNCTMDGDLRLQHALLSTLRNLAIPMANKVILAQTELVNLLLEIKHIEAYPIVFKLLGTLRMLSDHQESVANIIANDSNFMERLIVWCSNTEHVGIKGESTRLLSSLVKNCPKIYKTIIKINGLKPLVEMVTSEHEIMANEAFISIIIIIASLNEEVENAFIEANIADHLHTFLKQCCEVLPANEILCNAFMLIKLLLKSPRLKSQLVQKGINDDIEKIHLDSQENLKEKVYQLLDSMKTQT